MTAFRLPARAAVVGTVVGLVLSSGLVAHADDLVTDLPASRVNGQPEVLALDGASGTTKVSIRPTSGSGKDKPGCDLDGGTVVVHPWVNSSSVTVSPNTLEFTSCDQWQTLTVTRTGPGHAMVKFDFDKNASSAKVTGPNVETAHFVVGGETAVEGPGCSAPATPTFSPDGATTPWFTTAPVVAASNGGDSVTYATSAAGPFGASPVLGDGVTTVFAKAVNACGSTTSDTTFHVDRVKPTAERAATNADGTPYVEGTWTNQTVTVHTTCSDATSLVASCPADVVVDADSGSDGTMVPAGTVTDNAGNSAPVAAFTVKRDTVVPTVDRTVTAGGEPYAPGSWTNQTVTVHAVCDDALSGVTDCPDDVVVDTDSADGNGTTVPGVTVHDAAGNTASADAVVVKRDTAGPVVVRTATVTGGTYEFGTWTNKTVTVHTDCTDALSGVVVASCPGDVTVDTDSLGIDGTSVPGGVVYDTAGNSTTAPAVVVKRDTAPPTVVRTQTVPGDAPGRTAPYVPGTWTNQTVTVHTECSDALSGLAAPCPADVVVASDSATPAGTVVPAVTVTDVAGNSAEAPAVTVKRDTVAPTVAVTGLASAYVTGGSVPTPACSVSDALSGPAGTPAPVVTPPSNTNGVGTWTVRCTGYDNAGNAGTATTTYTVTYGGIGSGWLQPILAGTKFSRGKAVPGKFKVGGSPVLTGFSTAGWKITAEPQPTGSKLGCVAQVGTFTLKSLNTADLKPTMRWDAGGQQYVLNADFRTATVGSCWQIKAVLDDVPATTFSSGTFQITN